MAAMREPSTDTAPHHQYGTAGGTEHRAEEEMMENSEPGEPGATPPPTTQPSLELPLPRPSTEHVPAGQNDNTSGGNPLAWHPLAQNSEAMPPLIPRPPQPRDMGPPDLGVLRRAYDVYHGMPPHARVDTFRGHFQGFRLDRRFAVAPLLHGATNICVRQLQAPPTPAEPTPKEQH